MKSKILEDFLIFLPEITEKLLLKEAADETQTYDYPTADFAVLLEPIKARIITNGRWFAIRRDPADAA